MTVVRALLFDKKTAQGGITGEGVKFRCSPFLNQPRGQVLFIIGHYSLPCNTKTGAKSCGDVNTPCWSYPKSPTQGGWDRAIRTAACPLLDMMMTIWVKGEGRKVSGSERNPGPGQESTNTNKKGGVGGTQELREESMDGYRGKSPADYLVFDEL